MYALAHQDVPMAEAVEDSKQDLNYEKFYLNIEIELFFVVKLC